MNFKRTVSGTNGKTYKLPDATYKYIGNLSSTDEVRDLAIKVAKATGYDARIIVFNYSESSFSNLEVITSPEARLYV